MAVRREEVGKYGDIEGVTYVFQAIHPQSKDRPKRCGSCGVRAMWRGYAPTTRDTAWRCSACVPISREDREQVEGKAAKWRPRMTVIEGGA